MSNLNTLPQTPKSFDRFEGQDHGTHGNANRANLDEYYDSNKEFKEKAEAEIASAEVTQGIDDYLRSLTPQEAEDEAAKLLEDSELDAIYASELEGAYDIEEDVHDLLGEDDERENYLERNEDDISDEDIKFQQAVAGLRNARAHKKRFDANIDDISEDDNGDYDPNVSYRRF